MNKKQVYVLLMLALYIVVGLTAASFLFFQGTKEKQISAFLPASIESAEKEYVIEKKPVLEEDTVSGKEPVPVPEEEPAPQVIPEPEISTYYKVTTTNRFSPLHVRTAPDLSAPIIGKLAPFSEAYVLEKGEEWSKIKNNSLEGYCSNQYLFFEEIPEEEFISP